MTDHSCPNCGYTMHEDAGLLVCTHCATCKKINHIDYTTKPEVLAACGVEILKVPPADLGLSSADGEQVRYRYNWYYGEMPPVLTMQELWDGLCKACAVVGFQPMLWADKAVHTYKDGFTVDLFEVGRYGTLNNCIAAALYTVLQQAEKKEG